MNDSVISILDLPDEILLMILSKLENIDVLYSLVGVNKRLDKMVCDSAFTRSIDLVATSSHGENESLSDLILSRFCLDILPRIHQHVECLTLEPLSMQCILRASDYPNLHKLNLVKIEQEHALYYFDDESPFAHIFKNQISHLTITITDDNKALSLDVLAENVYARLFTSFTSLTHLEFGTYKSSQQLPLVLHNLSSNICFSSNIVNLCVKVLHFDDCLCLLDGRLYQMHTLTVIVDFDFRVSLTTTNNTKGLHNLKCFSLTAFAINMRTYDNQIVPLLRQMSQLEQLTLSLGVFQRTTFIDGTHLNNEILSQMSHLHTFIFDIVTHIVISNEERKSINDIRSIFIQDVDCYIDYLPNGQGRCHVYSLSFTRGYFQNINNNFPGSISTSVRTLSVSDYTFPFEHDFFKRISRSFPLLNNLTVLNTIQQNEKRARQSYDYEQTSSIVEFSHLSQLNLEYAHVDYVEQFLLDTNTHLPYLNQLRIQYQHLITVTENFTSTATRVNCAKLKRLMFKHTIVHSKDFYFYFPLL